MNDGITVTMPMSEYKRLEAKIEKLEKELHKFSVFNFTDYIFPNDLALSRPTSRIVDLDAIMEVVEKDTEEGLDILIKFEDERLEVSNDVEVIDAGSFTDRPDEKIDCGTF